MKQVNCLIIDDEELAIRLLRSYVAKVPYLNLAGAVNSGFAAIDILNTKEIDLVFVDIEMPELSGMEFIRSLERRPAFIFVTAYREYAADAFEIDAIDYLVKPVSFERFLKAVNKYLKIHQEKTRTVSPDTIQFKADRKIHQVGIDQIIYVEGLKDYLKIHLRNGNRLIVKDTLSRTHERLRPFGFIRCHKSYIVPVSGIRAFNAEGLELGDVLIPIGRSYKDEVLKLLEDK